MRYFTNVHDLGDLKSALPKLSKSRKTATNMKPWESIRLVC